MSNFHDNLKLRSVRTVEFHNQFNWQKISAAKKLKDKFGYSANIKVDVKSSKESDLIAFIIQLKIDSIKRRKLFQIKLVSEISYTIVDLAKNLRFNDDEINVNNKNYKYLFDQSLGIFRGVFNEKMKGAPIKNFHIPFHIDTTIIE